jgi:hypothetical protein
MKTPAFYTPPTRGNPLDDPIAELMLREETPLEEIEVMVDTQLAWEHVTRPKGHEDD